MLPVPNQTIFISYSHKDNNLKDLLLKHLESLNFESETLDVWVDNSINAGDEWEEEIKKAIDKSCIAILLISVDFLTSKFIKEKEFPWLESRYELKRLKIIPFILKPCNWDSVNFFKKLQVKPDGAKPLLEFKEENGERDRILADFAKEVSKIYDKEKNKKSNYADSKDLFKKTFIIYKILNLAKEYKNGYVAINGNIINFFDYKNSLIEKWLYDEYDTPLDTVEELANNFSKIFSKKNPTIKIGIVRNRGLTDNLTKIKNFFEILKKVKHFDKKIVEELDVWSVESKVFANRLLSSSAKKEYILEASSMLSYDPKANILGSIFLFSCFELIGDTANEMRKKIFKTIEEKYNKQLTYNNSDIYSLEAFQNVFKDALEFISNNEVKIDFMQLLSKIELLNINMPTINKIDYKSFNKKLIEEQISNISNINIQKIYINPQAKLFYANSNETENIKALEVFLKRDISRVNFILLLGDFGHGKTTFFKYMTAKMSDDDNYIPVYISMRQHFIKNFSLKEAVVRALELKEKMTDEFWNKHNWLLFCDGFDELNIFYQNRQDWVTLVFSSLLKESKKDNIKIVLSSRPILFLDPKIKSKTVSQFDRLYLTQFNEQQIKLWLEKWSEYNNKITIEMIKERNLLDIVKTPVILFLVASIFHEELNEEGVFYTKSEVYKRFFDWTQKQEEKKHKIPQNYREILQEIAWQIFTHPDSTSGLLHYEIILSHLKEKFQLENFNIWNEQIFVAHAFKESKKEHIEFLHQSLREYLVAEKFFKIYFNIINEDDYLINISYNEAFLSKPITEAKVNFFIDMVKSLSASQKEKLKIKVKNIAHWPTILYQIAQQNNTIFKGYNIFRLRKNMIHKEHIFTDNQVIIANFVLLGYLFEIRLYDMIEEDFNLELLTQIQHFFKSDTQLELFEELLQKLLFKDLHFKYCQFNELNFNSYIISQIKFENIEFNGCNFANTQLENVEFNNTNFNGCKFENFKWNNFKHTEICKYNGCHFYRFNFQNKNFSENVTYRGCIFEASYLYYENFRGSKFIGCTFIDSSFSTNAKIDKDSFDIEFINCIWKKENRLSALNGKEFNIFEETGSR